MFNSTQKLTDQIKRNQWKREQKQLRKIKLSANSLKSLVKASSKTDNIQKEDTLK